MLLACCSAAVERRENNLSVAWSDTSILSKQGDNISLTCTVYNAGLLDVVRDTLTPRSTVALADMRPSEAYWTVSDNGHMKTEFTQLGRYNIGFKSLRSTVTVQLNISGKYMAFHSTRQYSFFSSQIHVWTMLLCAADLFYRLTRNYIKPDISER